MNAHQRRKSRRARIRTFGAPEAAFVVAGVRIDPVEREVWLELRLEPPGVVEGPVFEVDHPPTFVTFERFDQLRETAPEAGLGIAEKHAHDLARSTAIHEAMRSSMEGHMHFFAEMAGIDTTGWPSPFDAESCYECGCIGCSTGCKAGGREVE